MIVASLVEVLHESVRGLELGEYVMIDWLVRSLIRLVIGILFLDGRWRGAKSVDGQNMVGNVILDRQG